MAVRTVGIDIKSTADLDAIRAAKIAVRDLTDDLELEQRALESLNKAASALGPGSTAYRAAISASEQKIRDHTKALNDEYEALKRLNDESEKGGGFSVDKRHSLMLSQSLPQLAAGLAEGTTKASELHHALYGLSYVAASMNVGVGAAVAVLAGLTGKIVQAHEAADKFSLERVKDEIEASKASASEYAAELSKIEKIELAPHEKALERITQKWREVASMTEKAYEQEASLRSADLSEALAALDKKSMAEQALESTEEGRQKKALEFERERQRLQEDDKVAKARDDEQKALEKTTELMMEQAELQKAMKARADEIAKAYYRPGELADEAKDVHITDQKGYRGDVIMSNQAKMLRRQKELEDKVAELEVARILSPDTPEELTRLSKRDSAELEHLKEVEGLNRSAIKTGDISFSQAEKDATKAGDLESIAIIERIKKQIQDAHATRDAGQGQIDAMQKRLRELELEVSRATIKQSVAGQNRETAEAVRDNQTTGESVQDIGRLSREVAHKQSEIKREMAQAESDARQLLSLADKSNPAATNAIKEAIQHLKTDQTPEAMRQLAQQVGQWAAIGSSNAQALISSVQGLTLAAQAQSGQISALQSEIESLRNEVTLRTGNP